MALTKLREDIARRAQTDKMMSTVWCIMPLVGMIVFIVLFFIGLFMAGGPYYGYGYEEAAVFSTVMMLVGVIIFGVLTIYPIYMLIVRRNLHFRRVQALYADAIEVLREASAKTGVDISGNLMLIERYLGEMRMEETEKSAVLWIILLFIPFVNFFASLYVLYFLTKDWYQHERREDEIWNQINMALNRMGYRPIDTRRPEPIPSRSFFLYFILSILIPLWAIYWLYVLIKDPNNHFKSHVRMEDDLLMALEAGPGAPAAPTAPAPGAPPPPPPPPPSVA